MLGFLLVLTILVGLLIQYQYLNQRIINDQQESSIATSEYLRNEINSQIQYHIQSVNAIAEFIDIRQAMKKESLEFFKRMILYNPSIQSIYYTDKNGQLLSSDGWIPPEDYNIKRRPWYIKAVQEKKLIISEMYRNSLYNDLIITIAKPIYQSENHQFLGVVAADITMEEIVKMVDQERIKGIGYSFLMDGSGHILAHPKYNYQEELEVISLGQMNKELYEQMRMTKTGEHEVILDGIKGYLTYQPIEQTDWTIVSFICNDPALQNIKYLWKVFLITLFFLMFLVFYFNYLQKKYFLTPIFRLEEDIENIDIENNLGYRVPLIQHSPFIELRKSINFVLDTVQELFEQLQQDEEELVAQNEELKDAYQQLVVLDEEVMKNYIKLMESEEQLQKALDQNNAIMQAIPDILFIVNDEGLVMDIQAPSQTQFSLKKPEFLNKKIEEVLPSNILNMVKKKIEKVLQYGQIESCEYELDVPGGTSQYYELRLVMVNDKEIMIIMQNITERKELENQLKYLSYHDKLTGLYNRRYFEKALKNLDVEENLPLTVMVADINGLKLINDTFGHDAGDQLLIHATDMLQIGCKDQGVIARTGGDEFSIILPKVDNQKAEQLVKKMQELNTQIEHLNIELSISFGCATKEHIKTDIFEVIKEADEKMYAHKLFEGPDMRTKGIDALMQNLYKKNNKAEEHSKRVSVLCGKMGEVLGMKEKEMKELEKAGFLHDIGKVVVHRKILEISNYHGHHERKEMRKHPDIGYRILNTVEGMSKVAEYILFHHERYDGSGYPKGLKGEEIPLGARILSIVNVYDAMLQEESNYKEKNSQTQVIKKLRQKAGTHLDPMLTKIFIEEVLELEFS